MSSLCVVSLYVQYRLWVCTGVFSIHSNRQGNERFLTVFESQHLIFLAPESQRTWSNIRSSHQVVDLPERLSSHGRVEEAPVAPRTVGTLRHLVWLLLHLHFVTCVLFLSDVLNKQTNTKKSKTISCF